MHAFNTNQHPIPTAAAPFFKGGDPQPADVDLCKTLRQKNYLSTRKIKLNFDKFLS